MQLRLRFCNGIEQGARSRDVQGVIGLIGRLSARVHLSDWAMRAFDPSVYRSSVPHLNKNARGVTCVAQHTQRIRTERRSGIARSPHGRWGRSLVSALHDVGMEGLRPRRLLDRGGKLQRCAWIRRAVGRSRFRNWAEV